MIRTGFSRCHNPRPKGQHNPSFKSFRRLCGQVFVKSTHDVPRDRNFQSQDIELSPLAVSSLSTVTASGPLRRRSQKRRSTTASDTTVVEPSSSRCCGDGISAHTTPEENSVFGVGRMPVKRQSSTDTVMTDMTLFAIDGEEQVKDPLQALEFTLGECDAEPELPSPHSASSSRLRRKWRKVRQRRADKPRISCHSMLQAALTIGEASDIPYLKGLAGLLSILSRSIQETDSNREACRRMSTLLSRIFGIVNQTRQGTQRDPKLERDLETLQRRIEELIDVIAHHLRRRYIYRFIDWSREKLLLQDCEIRLRGALDIFKLRTLTDAQVTMKQMGEKADIDKREFLASLQEIKDVSEVGNRLPLSSSVAERPESDMDEMGASLHWPPPPQTFIGRDSELRRIANIITAQQSHLAIRGPGGSGKSLLAHAVFHDKEIVRYFCHRRYFVDCDLLRNPSDLLVALHGVLEIPTPIPNVLKALGNQSEPLLILLDNIDTIWEPSDTRGEVEGLLTDISQCGSVSLMVTLRGTQLPYGPLWYKPYRPLLSSLLPIHARELFFTISGLSPDEVDGAALDDILSSLDSLPQPIALLGYLAQYEPPIFLFERLLDEGISILEKGTSRMSNMLVSITASLQSPRLRTDRFPETSRILETLALMTPGTLRSELCKTLSPTFHAIAAILSLLVSVGIVEEDATGALRLPNLFKHYLQRSWNKDSALI